MSVLRFEVEDASSLHHARTTGPLITIVMSSAVAAPPQRLWRALTVPEELLAWDEHRLSAVDPTDAYPKEGETVRWRYRLGSVPIVMRDKPLDVVPGRKLRSKVALGSLVFDQTFTLAVEQNQGDDVTTLLGMKVAASNSAAVMGTVIDRFEVRRMTADHVDSTLRAITKHCEGDA
ncbi:MAG: SRPBCC domain-containing protein [Myxococcota bacterium]|nr:SRPBCC domain-containing protein [Myxococcota bacterium]